MHVQTISGATKESFTFNATCGGGSGGFEGAMPTSASNASKCVRFHATTNCGPPGPKGVGAATMPRDELCTTPIG